MSRRERAKSDLGLRRLSTQRSGIMFFPGIGLFDDLVLGVKDPIGLSYKKVSFVQTKVSVV